MKLTSKSRRQALAFTMIEILLAMGIFSMVLIAIYSCWSAIMRGTRLGLSAAAEVQRTRVAIHALEEALGSAVMYADNALYYSFFADTSGDFAYLSFVARLPESFPGSGLFPGQPLRRVTFQVDDKKNLLLSQSTLLDISEQPYTITLAPAVNVFAAEFFNVRRAEWIPEWISTNSMPVMVRVALNFGPKEQGSQGVTIRSIPLTAQAISRLGGAQQQQSGPRRSMRRGQNQNQGEGTGGDGGLAVIPGGGGFDEYTGPSWSPRLPQNFGVNRGNNPTRNSIFPQ